MADKSLQFSSGGQITTTVGSTGNADLVIFTGPGRLNKMTITTGSTTGVKFWDSATTSGAAGAQAVYTVATTTTAVGPGIIYDLQIPITNGLVVTQVATGPSITLTYSKDTAYGR